MDGVLSRDGLPTFPYLQLHRPTVYLDQWVWIRLAKVVEGRPQNPMDVDALQQLRSAAAAGVVFPLSTSHYSETLLATPRQRRTLAQVMAELSYMQTLRSPSVLIDHQLKNAMHEQFGRPTFRPTNPQVLGVGVNWAFVGDQLRLTVAGGDRNVALAEAMLDVSLIEAHQWAEMRLLSGPRDEQITELRAIGYHPESAQLAFESRLAFEVDFAAQIASGSVRKSDLRMVVQMRELTHEHWGTLTRLLAEYGLTPEGVFGTDPRRVKKNRETLTRFADAVPSMRVAVDLKTQHFLNPQKPLSGNAIRDIDALGAAVPYCDVVMPDKEMGSLLSRSKVADDLSTTVVTSFPTLLEALPPLVERAQTLGGNTTGWGEGISSFRVTAPPGLEDF